MYVSGYLPFHFSCKFERLNTKMLAIANDYLVAKDDLSALHHCMDQNGLVLVLP